MFSNQHITRHKEATIWGMSGQHGVLLIALGGLFCMVLMSGIWMLLYSYGEQHQPVYIPSE